MTKTSKRIGAKIVPQGTHFPLGIVFPYAGRTRKADLAKIEPLGWYLCDGREMSRKLPLFDVIGTLYGVGDSVDTFNLPDYRGRFLRGVDDPTNQDPAGRDPDASRREGDNGARGGKDVGSVQGDELKRHSHHFKGEAGWPQTGRDTACYRSDQGTITTSEVGGRETRPKNSYINFIIFGGLLPSAASFGKS